MQPLYSSADAATFRLKFWYPVCIMYQRPLPSAHIITSCVNISVVSVNLIVYREMLYTSGILFLFLGGGHGIWGWYDNPQPALRPVLAQCATPCVLGCLYVCYCHTDNARLVSVRALYCIFIVPSPAASFSRYQAFVPTPDRHRVTHAHLPSQQGHSGLVLRWPDVVHTA